MDFKKIKGAGAQRISVEMLDPIMAPGEARAAIAPITVKPSGLNCQAELFLGPDPATKSATSDMIPFTSTGAAQSVRLPVIMPSPGGFAYHVYIDGYTNGVLIFSYVATEDVIIPAGSVGPITWE